MQKLNYFQKIYVGAIIIALLVLAAAGVVKADPALDAAEFQLKYYVERDARLKAEFRINTIDMEAAKKELIKLRQAAAQTTKKAQKAKVADSDGSGEE